MTYQKLLMKGYSNTMHPKFGRPRMRFILIIYGILIVNPSVEHSRCNSRKHLPGLNTDGRLGLV